MQGETTLTRTHTFTVSVLWGGYTSESRYGARDIQVYPKIYQTVVLRLPYITSHAVGSRRSPRPTCVRPDRALPFPPEMDAGEESL